MQRWDGHATQLAGSVPRDGTAQAGSRGEPAWCRATVRAREVARWRAWLYAGSWRGYRYEGYQVPAMTRR